MMMGGTADNGNELARQVERGRPVLDREAQELAAVGDGGSDLVPTLRGRRARQERVDRGRGGGVRRWHLAEGRYEAARARWTTQHEVRPNQLSPRRRTGRGLAGDRACFRLASGTAARRGGRIAGAGGEARAGVDRRGSRGRWDGANHAGRRAAGAQRACEKGNCEDRGGKLHVAAPVDSGGVPPSPRAIEARSL